VFYFERAPRPSEGITLTYAQDVAKSLDCAVATKDQLEAAQRNGAQECGIAIAADGKKYTVRASRVTAQNPFTTCPPDQSGGGVKEQTLPATGIWLYGIKPAANHLSEVLPITSFFSKPIVGNWYSYYKQQIETGISPQERQNRYSGVVGDEDELRPNYRGICIQMETTGPQNINVGVEDFITRVGNNELSGSLTNKLQHYSRNGRFADSERIATPKPPATPTSTNPFSKFNASQYWLWSPVTTANGNSSQSAEFKFDVIVPGYFAEPTHLEDAPKCLNSILYENQDYVNRVIGSACDEGLIENDNNGCP
jgi:hypothetical protein